MKPAQRNKIHHRIGIPEIVGISKERESKIRIIKIEKKRTKEKKNSYLIGDECLIGERVEDGNGEDHLKLRHVEKYLIFNLTSH